MKVPMVLAGKFLLMAYWLEKLIQRAVTMSHVMVPSVAS